MFGFDLVKCHRESNAYGSQLIFVVSWLHCAFVVRAHDGKQNVQKRERVLRPIYSLRLHISGHMECTT